MSRSTWGVVLTGGASPDRLHAEPFLRRAGRTVAADSGLDLAISYGFSPDLVVGDMDSLADLRTLDEFPADRVCRFDHDKDETDTEIALRMLFEEGFSRVALIGGGGGRLDHLMAIIALFDRDVRPSVWLTDEAFVCSLESEVELRGCAGRRVSFFPVGEGPCRMRSTGLQWALDGLLWRRGDVGVSNRITDDRMRVTMESGRLLMVCGADLPAGAVV